MVWSAGRLVLYRLAGKRDTDSKIMGKKKIRVRSEYPTENREEASLLRDLLCGTPQKHIYPLINPLLAPSITFTLKSPPQSTDRRQSSLCCYNESSGTGKESEKGRRGKE